MVGGSYLVSHPAAPENDSGTALPRRGYSSTDGVDPHTGMLEAGLFFIAFMRSPANSPFSQTRLGRAGPTQRVHPPTSSALCTGPPGLDPAEPDDYSGRALLET